MLHFQHRTFFGRIQDVDNKQTHWTQYSSGLSEKQTVVAEQQQQHIASRGRPESVSQCEAFCEGFGAPEFRAVGFRSEVWFGWPMISRFKNFIGHMLVLDERC